MSKQLEVSKRIQNRSTGITAISQHLVNTTDYICGSLLIHYKCDNTKMIELVCLVIISATQYICIMQLLQFIKIINNKS